MKHDQERTWIQMVQNRLSLTPDEQSSPGLVQIDKFQEHKNVIWWIAWSPDGRTLASGSADKTIFLWDTEKGKLRRTLRGHTGSVCCVAWSPNSRMLASGSSDNTVRLWDARGRSSGVIGEHDDAVCSVTWSWQGRKLASASKDQTICIWDVQDRNLSQKFERLGGTIWSVAWSPDGRVLASGSGDNTIRLWNKEKNTSHWMIAGRHNAQVSSVAWSPDGQMLASASLDQTIRLWDPRTGRLLSILEGHTGPIASICFSSDGQLFASKSFDGSVWLWRCDNWKPVGVLRQACAARPGGLAFHPQRPPILATRDDKNNIVCIWHLNYDVLLETAPPVSSIDYTNAKVVLVGEMGTGKTCLARALMGKDFEPQESSHGMKVWTFQSETIERPNGIQITRETLLWDLAGQTDYQVVHQLFLDETTLGIVLFDPTHPENPFGGVAHWEKALRRVVGENCPRLLVAGRVDRGYPTATVDDIEAFRCEHGFDAYIATSAKTGQGVEDLRVAITRAIPWDRLPVTSSPGLWKDIREYLLTQRAGEDMLTRRSDLCQTFRQRRPDAAFTKAEFDTVIHHAQAQGLVWRLSFGDFVLLRPELLNNYASAVVRVARKHPKGLGCVWERDVLEARIDFEDLKRLADTETERALLHAVVELFLYCEVALREGEYLVFPSKFNRKRPKYPRLPRREVAYRFAGPIEDIYATLVVRLFYSGAFELKDLWKNAAEFCDPVDRICGFLLSSPEEGHGMLSVFFEEKTTMNSKVVFLRFIHEHLHKRALTGSVARERIYRCLVCSQEVESKRAIASRLEQGRETITCHYCDAQIRLIDLLEEKFGDPELLRQVRALEEEVEEKREQAVGMTMAKAKQDIGEFDVFLAHNSRDKPQITALAGALKGRGLNPWLDIEQIPPGRWFQDVIQKVVPRVKSAAIIVGSKGLGKWQILELRAFVSQCVEKDIPVIPVLLPGITELPSELLFLRELHCVSFREHIGEMEALDNLEWGITQEHPRRRLK